MKMKYIEHLLDYMATHPNAFIRHNKYNMILNIHSDISYITKEKVRSINGGHSFLVIIPIKIYPINING